MQNHFAVSIDGHNAHHRHKLKKTLFYIDLASRFSINMRKFENKCGEMFGELELYSYICKQKLKRLYLHIILLITKKQMRL